MTPLKAAAAEAGDEDISMEDVLGPGVRKQPAPAKEAVDEEVPQVETPDVLNRLVDGRWTWPRPLAPEGNTRAGRPARVKVCKGESWCSVS